MKKSLIFIILLIAILAIVCFYLLTLEKIKSFTVFFETNGGSPVEALTEVPNGSKISKPDPDPTKPDHRFVNWYKDQSLEVVWDFEKDAVYEDLTLYAKWASNSGYSEGDLQINFLELGNQYAGDSVYIKAGDVDILIDAGSRAASAKTIGDYLRSHGEDDGIIDYVIATHAHQDHIAGFVGNKANKGIFDQFECKIIIDYAYTNSTSNVRKNYEAARNAEVLGGAKHYTAADCINGTNGGQKVFKISDDISLEILDQRFYHEKSNDENNYSVCLLLKYKEDNFLFTGDLELEGEESLVALNDLPHCKVFKGGHHGSKTSSNDILLAEITPEVVCICCCAGSNEYTSNIDNMFPTQEVINRLAKYTDRIYVTSLALYEIGFDNLGNETLITKGYTSMNGNIVVSINSSNEVVVIGSNNNTILKDTEWFNQEITISGVKRKMRTWPEGGG